MEEMENKRVNSTKSAITSLMFTAVNGILSFFVTRIILINYGSDFNGLNSTANQIINMLLIIESGFTIASNVALFAPLAKQDDKTVSRIISTTKHAFFWIGGLFYGIGIIVIVLYSFFVHSDASRLEVISIMLMALFPTGLNLLIATKYVTLFQSKQQEYLINIIKISCCILGQILVLIIGSMNANRLVVRAFMMINPIMVIVLITIIGKKVFSRYSTRMKPDYSLIKGTRDLLAQRLLGMAYSTLPTLVISARLGTEHTSVYGVYNMVTVLIKSIANAAINAPRMSLGALIAEGNERKTAEIFKQYEVIVFILVTPMFMTYMVMILPFVRIYTNGITDINYVDQKMAILLGIILFMESIHIPSGIYINMAGHFKAARNIQLSSAIVLGVSMVYGAVQNNVYAIIISVLCAAFVLAVLEISYVHLKCLKRKVAILLKLAVSALLSIGVILVESALLPSMDNFFGLVGWGIGLCLINASLTIAAYYIIDASAVKKIMKSMRSLARTMLGGKLFKRRP